MSKNSFLGINSLKPFDEERNELNVIIETPKGSRNKYTFDEDKEIFKLGGILPLGANFPFDFGFIPQTVGADGDPLDVLLLMDEAAFPGCLVGARLVGVIEANQSEDGKTLRNDRLIAVACRSLIYDQSGQSATSIKISSSRSSIFLFLITRRKVKNLNCSASLA